MLVAVLLVLGILAVGQLLRDPVMLEDYASDLLERQVRIGALHELRLGLEPSLLVEGLSIEEFWLVAKMRRRQLLQVVLLTDTKGRPFAFGVPPSVPTWGSMLSESRDHLLSNKWWLAVFPGLAIVFTVLAFNIIGDWLRDFLDPRLKENG